MIRIYQASSIHEIDDMNRRFRSSHFISKNPNEFLVSHSTLISLESIVRFFYDLDVVMEVHGPCWYCLMPLWERIYLSVAAVPHPGRTAMSIERCEKSESVFSETINVWLQCWQRWLPVALFSISDGSISYENFSPIQPNNARVVFLLLNITNHA